ncbi:S-formylglutathione hydrolase [bacterium]|nr:S-formylglutathione hydrolase [bacterium]
MDKVKSHRCFSGVTEFYKHSSEITGTEMNFSVYQPSNDIKIKGGLIWLSGLTCNEENFITKAGAQKFLDEHGLIIICPDTSPRGLNLENEHESYDFGSGAGFYVDATIDPFKTNYNMYSYINEELYALFNEHFKLNGNISIFGHSMGGHGALTLGLKNPSKYKSISAFSPIVNPMNCAWGQKAFKGYLGDDRKQWEAYDACELLKSGKKHEQSILIDQGTADEFYPEQLLTQNFEQLAQEYQQGLQVNYREGFDHSYYFIASFVENHIKHHAKYLG